MLRKEPALIFAVLAAVVQAGVIFFTSNPGVGPEWILPALTLAAGWLTRSQVFSEQTIEDAGHVPADLQARAERVRLSRAAEG